MAAKIVTVFNQKGGVGKTTTAMQLAGALSRLGFRVQVFDMDVTKGGCLEWAANAQEDYPFPAKVQRMATFGGKIHNEMAKYINDCDVLIIDCPPSADSPVARSTLTMADLAIIPVTPLSADYQASVQAMDLAREMRMMNADLKILAVATRVSRKPTATSRQILEKLKASEDIPLAKTMCSDLAAYSDSVAFGITVHDVPRSPKAVAEVNAFAEEVLVILEMEAAHG